VIVDHREIGAVECSIEHGTERFVTTAEFNRQGSVKMPNIVSVSPFRCRMWSSHDRFDQHVNEKTCKVEIESFSKHGQLVPVLGRVLRGDPDHDVELICGARRLFVARHINKPLLVELREMSDREAIIAMDIENRQRADVSPYERGVSYAHWLHSGQFGSQDEIAHALKISKSQVSRLLSLSKLPSVILNAFSTPTEICETWGLSIIEALDDPQRRQRTMHRARAIAALNPRPPAREVYRQLIAASAQQRPANRAARDRVVKDDDGVPLFRVRHRSNSVTLLLPSRNLSQVSMESICCAVAGILHRAKGSVLDSQRQRSRGMAEQDAYEVSDKP
jgi:ParB family chromosome partitioning protein